MEQTIHEGKATSSEGRKGYRVTCPSCGATYWYGWDKIDEDGSVECQNCALRVFTDSVQGKYRTVSSDESDAIVPSRKPFLTLDTREGVRIRCPECSAQYVYKDYHRMKDGRVHCQNCGALIDAVGEDVLVYETPVGSTGQENVALLLIVVLIILFVPLILAVPVVICIAAFKFCGLLRSDQDETKIYRRDTEGPDLR